MSSLARRATAEMLGTALLVFFGCAAILINVYPGAGYQVFGIAVIHAFILSLAISMTMGVSGGNLNPAVTLGLLAIRKINSRDAFVYIVSQLAGALLAALAVRYVLPDSVGRVVAYGTPTINPVLSFGHAAVIEAIFGFVLMSGVMGTVVAANAPRIAGFGVGLTLIPIIMIGGPMTGGVANPARAFGPAIISGNVTAQGVWWVGPIAGAVIAALLWHHVILKEVPEEGLVPEE